MNSLQFACMLSMKQKKKTISTNWRCYQIKSNYISQYKNTNVLHDWSTRKCREMFHMFCILSPYLTKKMWTSLFEHSVQIVIAVWLKQNDK